MDENFKRNRPQNGKFLIANVWNPQISVLSKFRESLSPNQKAIFKLQNKMDTKKNYYSKFK